MNEKDVNKWLETGETPMPTEEPSRITTTIPKRLHKQLRLDKATSGRDIGELLTEILDAFYANKQQAA